MADTDPVRALQESEELHRITLLNMSDAVFVTNDDGVFTFICPNVDVIFGYGHDEVLAMERIARLLGRELIDPAELAVSGEVRNIEHEIEAKGGARRLLLVHIKCVSIRRGTILYVCRDITERRESERELRELSGRLINAHEQERIRLSRELHDDVGQRVALLSAELGVLRQLLADAPRPVREQLTKITGQTNAIGGVLHRFSHALHPARLEQLGLESSIRAFCDDLSEARQIDIQFEVAGRTPAIHPDSAVCLYRITQEALHNVVKHSSASHATVALTFGRNEVVLRVIDDGAGFDPQEVRRKDALGLVSMRERARLVQGHLSVSSKPGQGTGIEVRLPIM